MTRSIARPAAALLAAALPALAVAAIGAASSPAGAAKAKEDCGTYRSTSIYDKGRVFAIRGVKCRKARKVAKKYDHESTAPGPWKCALAHGKGKALFSCGYGASSGNIRDWPHALVVKGVGGSGPQPYRVR
jgi:hypothetical protein